MQDLGVYPLSNSPLVEGNPYLICLILILFYTFFPFSFRMEGKTLAPVREDTRKAFYSSPKCSNHGQEMHKARKRVRIYTVRTLSSVG